MRRILTSAIIPLLFFLLYQPCSASSDINDSEPKKSKIVLMGEFRSDGFRSGSDAITVDLNDDAIAVTFHKDLGELLITITDESGISVYETTVSTSLQQQAFIPLGLSSGTYTITFSNGRGEMWGEFEVG